VSGLQVIAHRGFAGVFPENTVRAVRGAVEREADAVEIDVQPTADGDPVVFHDRRLDGQAEESGRTDGTGVVWEQSTAEVTSARVLGTDECVPLLGDVLDAVPDHVEINVELKNPGSDGVRPGEALDGDRRERARERWAPFVRSVLSVTAGYDNDILYSSFCEGALAALADAEREVRLAVLVAPNCAAAGERVTRRYGVDAVHPPLEQLGDEAAVDWAAVAAGVDAALNVWTVRDWQGARRAVRTGADGIIADYPGLTDTL
jgi:glycerophosphoryl diester phosphodiesterase